MILTFQFRLLPSKRQHRGLEKVLDSQRELYNAALEERIEAHRKAGVTRTFFDQSKALTQWRREDKCARSVSVTIQRSTLKRVDQAYACYFRRLKQKGQAGLPRFRGKNRFRSFGFCEFSGVSFDGRFLRFKGLAGKIKVHVHREMPPDADIRSCAIQKESKGWIVSFAISVPAPPLRMGTRHVGMDLGILSYAALSDGAVIPSVRVARRSEARIRVAQRALARKKAHSQNRKKAVIRLARRHASIRRQRMNHLHQTSAHLVKNYDTIALEKLSVGALARSVLAKDVLDASWAAFTAMLRYKAERAGVRLIEVDPHGTSQECSGCKAIVRKELRSRWHECPLCGLSLDRDVNAARNILRRAGVGPGLRNVAMGGMRAGRNFDPDGFSRNTP